MTERTLPTYMLRRIAAKHDVDERTILKVLRNQRTLGMTRSRVIKALRAEGYGYLITQKDNDPRAA